MIGGFLEESQPIAPQTITIWTGAVEDIPPGWVLCDGNNGTPDLRHDFVKGAPNGADPGGTGGENFTTLTPDQLPPHSHTGGTSTDGRHSHGFNIDGHFSGTGDAEVGEGTNRNCTSNGAHSHSIEDDKTGSGSAINNQPAYRDVAFIMRL